MRLLSSRVFACFGRVFGRLSVVRSRSTLPVTSLACLLGLSFVRSFCLVGCPCSWGAPAAEGQLIRSWGATDYKDPTVHWGGEPASTLPAGTLDIDLSYTDSAELLCWCMFMLVMLMIMIGMAGMRMDHLPEENLRRLAGATSLNHDTPRQCASDIFATYFILFSSSKCGVVSLR